MAGGADEQRLLEAAGRLGRLRELGPVRRPLTEIFREALAAPAEAPGAETAAGTAEPTGGPAEAARTAETGREA